jgi:hypothetical protein
MFTESCSDALQGCRYMRSPIQFGGIQRSAATALGGLLPVRFRRTESEIGRSSDRFVWPRMLWPISGRDPGTETFYEVEHCDCNWKNLIYTA